MVLHTGAKLRFPIGFEPKPSVISPGSPRLEINDLTPRQNLGKGALRIGLEK